MKHTFNISQTATELVPDTSNRTAYLVANFVAVGMAGVIGWTWNKLPHMVPLWQTGPWGEGRLSPKIALWGLPVMVVLVSTINIGLSKLVGKVTLLIPRILSAMAVIVALTLGIALYGIVQSLSL